MGARRASTRGGCSVTSWRSGPSPWRRSSCSSSCRVCGSCAATPTGTSSPANDRHHTQPTSPSSRRWQSSSTRSRRRSAGHERRSTTRVGSRGWRSSGRSSGRSSPTAVACSASTRRPHRTTAWASRRAWPTTTSSHSSAARMPISCWVATRTSRRIAGPRRPRAINLGSVSNPITDDLRASYVVLDVSADGHRLMHRGVAYDHEEVVRRTIRSGHPATDYICSFQRGDQIRFPMTAGLLS